MNEKIFANLNPLSFLQTFISLSLSSTENNKASMSDKIEQLGLNAACCFETAYRQEFNLTEAVEIDKCAEMIIKIKNKIGGNFSMSRQFAPLEMRLNSRPIYVK